MASLGILQVTTNDYPQQAYDRFVDILNARLNNEDVPNDPNFNLANDRLMKLTINAALSSLEAKKLLAVMAKNDQPKDEVEKPKK